MSATRRLFLELLEDRTLLAASITGNVFNDVNGNKILDPGERPIAGATVYLDLNGNGQFDPRDSFPGSTAFQQIHGGFLDGYFAAPVAVSGVAASFSDVTVGLNLARTGSGGPQDLDVVLLSPQGVADASGPDLIHLQPVQSFNGTFSDSAAPLPPGQSHYTGTFQPLQPFTTSGSDILPYPAGGAAPSGTWLLLLADADTGNPVQPQGITLSSWSVSFTNPEPATTTDANGNYSFSGLAAGSYTVGVTGVGTAHDPTKNVTVAAGATTSGVNFPITPGSINGTVSNGSGQPVAGVKTYLDLNGNGQFDPRDSFPGSTAFQQIHGGPLDGYFAAPVAVSGVAASFSDVTVGLNLARSGPGGPQNLDLILVSPQGQVDFAGPDLVHLQAGQSFNGILSDEATPLPPGQAQYAGIYQPLQPFTTSGSDILPYPAAGAAPSGTWLLLLADADTFAPAQPQGITLSSWSVSFTNPEPTTTTDANGNYSFIGLSAGNYTVGVAGAVAGPDPQRTAAVENEQATTDVNFTITPAPDLVATSFQVVGGFATFGQTVTVNYTIANRGLANAGPFEVDLRLSPDDQIGGGDMLLDSFTVNGLAAGASKSGSRTVTLPGSVIDPPAGFTATGPIYLGLVVDPADTAAESNTANNSNQGLGTDTALVSNQGLTSDQQAEQQPTVAVDPNNPNHVVVAYMDFDLPQGYASIAVQTSADGGRSWSTTAVPLPAGFNGAAGYPSVAFDGQGHVYIAFMAATFSPGLLPPTIFADGRDSSGNLFRGYGTQANNGIFLSASGDGGLTWNAPVPVVEHTFTPGSPVPFEALPSLAIDTNVNLPNGRPNPNHGRFYITWTRYYPAGQMPGVTAPTGGSDILFAYSQDGGLTWITPGHSPANPSAASGVGVGPNSTVGLGQYTLTTAGQLILSLAPAAPVAGGALNFQLFTRLPGQASFSFAGQVTASGTQVVSATFPATAGEVIALQVQNATPAAQTFAVEFVNTDASSALRDVEYPADGAQPVGGGSDDISHVTVGPDGQVTVALNRGGLFRVFGSTDGGTFFSTLGDPFGDNFIAFPPDPLADEDFRNFPVRQILADPTRPGALYALEVVDGAFDPTNLAAITPFAPDGSRVVFARSTDDGKTWTDVFTVGGASSTSLDDDNGGQPLNLSASQVNQVVTGQAMPTMAVDADGNLSVIWYDTRRDPANHDLDVFGVTSSDGGQTFSANYRVSDTSFDPNAGQFPEGSADFDFGDGIGLAMANGIDFAAWTDTRNGNQDVFFAAYPVLPAPAAPNDRFEPNDLRETATDLGTVSVSHTFPRLALTPGDDDWYRLTTGATGNLIVTVSASGAGLPQTVELWGATGGNPLATVMPADGATDEQITFSSKAGQVYWVHVTGLPSGSTEVGYSLTVQSLTENLGTQVHAKRSGTVTPGDRFLYLIAPAVAGSLEVTLTTSAGLTLQQLSTDNQLTVLSSGPHLSIPVSAGQPVLIAVVGNTAADAGAYPSLEFTNLDQFTTSQNGALFFPTSGGTPTSLGVADLNGDGQLDLVTASTDAADGVNVLLNNGDGTFSASRGFDAGPGGGAGRTLAVGNFAGSGITGVAVTNFQDASVSVLPGNGDGTLQPPRFYNTITLPDAMVVGHLNGTNSLDLAVLQQFGSNGPADVSVLFNRGDGTFLPPITLATTLTAGAGQIVVGNFSGHPAGSNLQDIAVFGFGEAHFNLFVNQGNGVFVREMLNAPEDVASALAADLNGDGNTDLILGGSTSGDLYVLFGNGDGTFQPFQKYFANTDPAGTDVSVSGLALATITQAGQTHAQPDLIATVVPHLGSGSPQVVLLPAAGAGTFGAVQQLAVGPFTGPVVAGNLANNGADDVAAAVPGGVEVIYGKKPNINPDATRDLGTVVHWVGPPLTIVPGHTEATFTMTVPKEAVSGAGPEVIDFSALFQHTDGAGLGFEVVGPGGTQTGQRLEVVADAGTVLTLHVFGLPGGYGAYTLDIDVRPQVVSVAAQSLLPGGPVTSLVVTFQGDRLDAATAQDAANYTLIGLSPDGQTAFTLKPATINDALPAVYNPGANIDIATGLFSPTAARQTVTLSFAEALPAGSYLLVLSRAIQAAPYNDAEAGLLVTTADLGAQALVSDDNPGVEDGAVLYLHNLVPVASPSSNVTAFSGGTGFLTDYHDQLGALLAAQVTTAGDSPAITPALLDQSQQVFNSGTGAGSSVPSFLVLFLDPVPLSLLDPQAKRTTFDLQTDKVTNTQPKTYVDVGGNIEVVVVADVAGLFRLSVADVDPTARGGALIIGPAGTQIVSLTDALRAGVQDFTFDVPGAATAGPLGPAVEAPGAPAQGPTSSVQGAFDLLRADTTTSAVVEVTQAPVNEAAGNLAATGQGGATVTAAATGADPAGGGGSGTAGKSFAEAVRQALEQLRKVLTDLGKGAAADPMPLVEQGWEVLQSLGVPAVVVPLERVGQQAIRAFLRSLGAGNVGPGAQPPPPRDGAAATQPADGQEAAPVEPAHPVAPVEASGKGGMLWLAAALAGGLVPVWRRRRKRRDHRHPE